MATKIYQKYVSKDTRKLGYCFYSNFQKKNSERQKKMTNRNIGIIEN